MSLNKYNIEVTETLVRVIEIEAPSLNEAILKARQLYKEEKIVLDENDLSSVDIEEC